MNRVIFLIDGFNLYHSIIGLQKDTGIKAKWLNIYSLCKSYLPLCGKDSILEKIIYFSAIPFYKSSTPAGVEKIKRHQLYLSCLTDSGISVELGRFKKKHIFCQLCQRTFIGHEEKETDVAIGVRLVEILHSNLCDTVVVVTGDTDLAPAIRTCKELFKTKNIFSAFHMIGGITN